MVIETHKKCLRCGYEWESRVKRPVQCPRCKRYWWDIARRAGATIVIEGDARRAGATIVIEGDAHDG